MLAADTCRFFPLIRFAAAADFLLIFFSIFLSPADAADAAFRLRFLSDAFSPCFPH